MRKLVEKFVQYPIYANLAIFFVILAGVYAYTSMKKSFFPETESRFITISVFYPGASPIEMEEGVTSRLEEAVRGLIGIKEINSTSVENRSSVRLETTGEYDIDEVLIEVKNAVTPSRCWRVQVLRFRTIYRSGDPEHHAVIRIERRDYNTIS